MASRKVRDLRELNEKELIRQKKDLLDRMMEIRFKAKIESPSNPMEQRELKKQIARINTLLTEKQKEA